VHPEHAVFNDVTRGSGPINEGVIGHNRRARLLAKLLITDRCEVLAEVKASSETVDEAVCRNGGANVLDHISFGPNACLARELDHVEHDRGDVYFECASATVWHVPLVFQPFQAFT